MTTGIVFKLLSDPALYVDEMHRIALKLHAQRSAIDVEEEGLSFSDMYQNRERVARALAYDVSRDQFDFGIGRPALSSIAGKSRTLMRFSITARIVHGVISRRLSASIARIVHPQVFSYQAGRSWYDASLAAGDYIRRYRRDVPEIKARGLYVLRRDIRSYVDEIPKGPSSPLWPMLSKVLESKNGFGGTAAQALELLRKTIDPPVEKDGVHYHRGSGLPMGSPVANPIYNLYALPIDNLASDVPDSFYARYSDDFIFMHPSAAVVKDVEVRIESTLGNLGLQTNMKKAKTYFFNGAGRCSVEWPQAIGTSTVPFVGVRIRFTGQLILGKRKLRTLLSQVRERLHRSDRLVASLSEDERGRILARIANDSLIAHSSMSVRNADYLLGVMTDRSHLQELDYRLARTIAQIIARKKGARVLRRTSIQKIRNTWGLESLVVKRNRHLSIPTWRRGRQ